MFDAIYQGHAHGSVADRLLANGLDFNVLRPWIDNKGRTCISVFNGMGVRDGKVVPTYKTRIVNASGTFLKDQWIQMDTRIQEVQRATPRVWSDIQGEGLRYDIPNGMQVIMLQHQTSSDFGEAELSMSPLYRTRRDRPTHDLGAIPLMIVMEDFSWDIREIEVSRRGGVPLDLSSIENGTRNCVIKIEKLVTGTGGTYSYGGVTVYGLTNHPDRITQTMTLPTAGGWTPATTYTEVLAMVKALNDNYFSGPYLMWYSRDWDQYLERDYAATYQGKSLREKLESIRAIKWIRQADYLASSGVFRMVMAARNSSVLEAITGMRLKTIQWDEQGGLEKMMKIMGIMVPRIRTLVNKETGGTASGIVDALAA